MFKKVSEISKSYSLKVLTYGETGSGKTTWCAKSPKPLFILTEQQSASAILAVNKNCSVAIIKNWSEFKQVSSALKRAKKEEKNNQVYFNIDGEVFQTVIVDSLTALQSLAINEITGYSDNFEKSNILKIQEWGVVADLMSKVLNFYRSLDCNVIFTSLSQKNTDESGNVIGVEPLLSGKTKNQIGQYFNAVGYFHGKNIIWGSNPKTIAKQFPGFPQSMDRNVTLGSLALKSFEGAIVAHCDTDNASTVVEASREKEK
jgi:hypothetical protein